MHDTALNEGKYYRLNIDQRIKGCSFTFDLETSVFSSAVNVLGTKRKSVWESKMMPLLLCSCWVFFGTLQIQRSQVWSGTGTAVCLSKGFFFHPFASWHSQEMCVNHTAEQLRRLLHSFIGKYSEHRKRR